MEKDFMIAHTAFRENKRALFQIGGKIYSRVVRYRRDCGLYVTVNNRKYFEYEFTLTEEKHND